MEAEILRPLTMKGPKISEVFDDQSTTFVLCPDGIKFPPIEKVWQKKGHSYAEACAHKGNVGRLAGISDIGVDEDQPEAFDGLEVPNTATWETRPGRLGLAFKCQDHTPEVLVKYGLKGDQAVAFLYKNGTTVGELKLERSYQIIPPSWKIIRKGPDQGKRVEYKWISEIRPAEISLDNLLSQLKQLGISFKKVETPTATTASTTSTTTKLGGEKGQVFIKASEFLQQALSKDLTGARNKTGFDLVCQLRDLGIEPGKASEYLRTYSENVPAGDHPYTYEEAMKSLEQAYSREPREPPHITRPTPALTPEPSAQPQDRYTTKELLEAYYKWLYIREEYQITGPYCGVLAAFCPGDPDILGLVASSGSVKTETIRAFGKEPNEYIYPISSITAKTLISGKKGVEGLAPKLKGRVLMIKDLTTMLEKEKNERAQIFAQFREMTDGYLTYEYGNDERRNVLDIHSSIVFASTSVIEHYYAMTSSLGQRMMFFKPEGDRQIAMNRARTASATKEVMRKELHAVTMGFLAKYVPAMKAGEIATISEEMSKDLEQFYMFLAKARATIHADWKGDPDDYPEIEYPTRIASTIDRIIKVHATINDRTEANKDDIDFGKRIVLDTIPTNRWKVLTHLSTRQETTPSIAAKCGLPTTTTHKLLDALFSIGVILKWSKSNSDEGISTWADSYALPEETNAIITELRKVECPELKREG